MGHQIIKQPDGLLAVWSTGTDSWILYDATPEELVKYYVDKDAERTRRQILELTDLVLADKPWEAYYQFTKTFEEAQAEHLEGGHSPVPFAHLAESADKAEAGPVASTLHVTVAVDTDELRKWADWHAERGHHGVAHVLYKAASDGETLTQQALSAARFRLEALADEWESCDENGNQLRDGSLTDAADELRALIKEWRR